jgi:hypothetical protein
VRFHVVLGHAAIYKHISEAATLTPTYRPKTQDCDFALDNSRSLVVIAVVIHDGNIEFRTPGNGM